jgi:ABC-type lipoprotein release transport system permease subunit
MRPTLARFGRYLANRRNFIRYIFVAMGVPNFVLVTWLYFVHYRESTIFLWLYMVSAVGGVAYLCGLLMWKFFMEERSKRILGQQGEAP